MECELMSQLVPFRATGAVWRRARALMQRLIRAINDGYRPERYYMRGPGPKAQARDRSRASDT
jgi:hypothetical protein